MVDLQSCLVVRVEIASTWECGIVTVIARGQDQAFSLSRNYLSLGS